MTWCRIWAMRVGPDGRGAIRGGTADVDVGGTHGEQLIVLAAVDLVDDEIAQALDQVAAMVRAGGGQLRVVGGKAKGKKR